MASVPFMGSSVGLILAVSLNKSLERLLIAPLVDIGSTLDASQVTCGLFKLVLLLRWCLCTLLLQKLFDDLLPGLFFC